MCSLKPRISSDPRQWARTRVCAANKQDLCWKKDFLRGRNIRVSSDVWRLITSVWKTNGCIRWLFVISHRESLVKLFVRCVNSLSRSCFQKASWSCQIRCHAQKHLLHVCPRVRTQLRLSLQRQLLCGSSTISSFTRRALMVIFRAFPCFTDRYRWLYRLLKTKLLYWCDQCFHEELLTWLH